jgi:hypothetical protein
MLTKPIFVNKFEKGQSENANIGYGAVVGLDIYSKKGVVMLAKQSTTVYNMSGTEYPTFFAVSTLGTTWWAQTNRGNVYYTSSATASGWTDGAFPTGATGGVSGNGLVFFQNYILAFSNTSIYYTSSSTPTAGSWVNWTDTKALGSLHSFSSFATSPITALHYPFLYPSNRGVYFGNASSGGVVGFFGQNGTTTFDPSGVTGTAFLYNNSAFNPGNNTYAVGAINFLPPSNLAIAAYAFQDPSSADLITWDTISTNKFTPPLRLPSAQLADSTGVPINSGIKQMANRNQVLYAISGGNHSIYETNSSSFNLIDSINLFSNVRAKSGAETALPPFFNSFPQAICVMGNKIISGLSTPPDNSIYTSGGIFPFGAWSITFNRDGTKSSQCEYQLPSITLGGLPQNTTVSPTGANNYAYISALYPVGTNKLLMGYAWKDSNVSATAASGIALVSTTDYITDRGKTALESPLFEIGTALNPQAVNNIEILFAKKLLTNESFILEYRTSLADDWTSLLSVVEDGTNTTGAYKVTDNSIGAVQYLQLRFRMAASSDTPTNTPYLRNIIIS